MEGAMAEDYKKDLREKMTEFIREKEKEFQKKQDGFARRELLEERGKLSKEIREQEEQKVASRETEYQLRMKELEKQLEKVLLNAAHVRGSIEGIAGKDAIDVNLLDDEEDELLLD
jgi:hypothetical protein